MKRLTDIKLGKFISLVLRHKPEVIGISLDKNGWADVKELIEKINLSGRHINIEILERIVEIYNNFEEIENISRFVSVDEVLLNEGSLIVIKYITPKKEKKDVKVLFEDVKKIWLRQNFMEKKVMRY